MAFQLEFKPKAVKDLDKLPTEMAGRVIQKLESLRSGLKGGDVKRLTNFSPEYRLRVGDYRALFEVEGASIVVYRVIHRREAYR
ncbi:MAG: type II toxin-antitoxin system RelE/ParE family toxin [Verrucomicrobiaceae bacterium]|jgi:mRNA interferase RelE/StbE